MKKKNLIVGVVAIGGSGKSTFLREFQKSDYYSKGSVFSLEMTQSDVKFCNPPTLKEFWNHSSEKQREYHNMGLKWLKELRDDENKHIILCTHFSLAYEDDDFYEIMDDYERDFYDLIIYLDYDPEEVYRRHLGDRRRKRGLTLSKIIEWSEFEKRGVHSFFSKNTEIVDLKEDVSLLRYVIKRLEEHDNISSDCSRKGKVNNIIEEEKEED